MPSGGISKLILEPLPARQEEIRQASVNQIHHLERSSIPQSEFFTNLKSDDYDNKNQNHSKVMIKSDRSIREGPAGYNKSASPDIKKSNFFDISYDKLNKSTTRIEYQPYTISDYKNIKFEKYFELGGLGPTYVGSEDWVKKKELYDKRRKYGKGTYYRNVANMHLEPLSRKLFVDNSARKRAIDFAKSIIRPPLRAELADKD